MGEAVLWSKAFLKPGTFGKVTFRGPSDEVTITRGLIIDVMHAFSQHAVASVPFFIADVHTWDPLFCAGDVVSLTWDESTELLHAQIMTAVSEGTLKEIGVAPQIIMDYRAADGQVFPAVLRQLLGTSIGRVVIPDLPGWERA